MGAADRIVKVAGENAVSGRLIALFKALRPKQWIKNGLVFLPFVFAVNQVWSLSNLAPVPSLLLQLVAVFLAFCAVSSAVYLLNDLMDRESDRRHPIKRHRPIASGKVTAPTAIAFMIVLGLGGLAVMAVINPLLGGLGLPYFFFKIVFSFGAKRA